MSATSAVSSAAWVPAAPIAIPTVAAASAGASFTPSPTTATEAPPASSRRTAACFSSGSSRAADLGDAHGAGHRPGQRFRCRR